MRCAILCLLIFALIVLAAAQDTTLLENSTGVAKKKLGSFFSSKKKLAQKLDSTTSINSPLAINATSTDTLKPDIKHYTHTLDSTKGALTHTIDSLHHIQLPTAKYERMLDSITRIDPLKNLKQYQASILAKQQKMMSRITGIESQATGKVSSLTQKLQGKFGDTNSVTNKLSVPGDLQNKLPDVSLPNTSLPNTTMPNIDLPNTSLPTTSLPNTTLPTSDLGAIKDPVKGLSIPGVGKDVSQLTTLPQKEISGLKNSGPLKDITKETGEITQLGNKASGYGNDVSGVLKGDSASMAKLEGKVESELKNNASELKGFDRQKGVVDQYKKMATSAGNPDELKKEAIVEVQKQAVNHFAGQEQALKTAMDHVSKLKQKYSSLNSLSEIPKRVPNAMHGKPLIERLVPGINFQVLKTGNKYTIDLNPAIAYRVSGRINAGAGWNERVTISHYAASAPLRFYGPRLFGEFKIKSGFNARVDFELMNTIVPPNQVVLLNDPNQRRWIWGAYAGMKRDYKLLRHLKGNVQMMYNMNSLFDRHHINLYGNPLVVRIGFEVPLSKRKGRITERH